MKISLSEKANARPFRHTWEGLVNVDQFKWLGRHDIREALKMAYEELNARQVRAVGMFGTDSRVICQDPTIFDPEKRSKELRTNFQIIDYYFDNCIEVGVTPMFTAYFTPDAMATGPQKCLHDSCNITAPKDLSAFAELVKETTEHMVMRYGKSRMREWLFEIWNEPNLEGAFWVGGQDIFHQLWKVSYDAIKSVDKDFRIGGPSTARAGWIEDLVKFSRANNCEPDYLITHIYNNDSIVPESAFSPFGGPPDERSNKSPHFASGVIKGVKDLVSELNFTGEVHWNEWGRSWFPGDVERETANEAAYIVKTMAEVSQDADLFSYWCLSDVYDQLGYGRETFHKQWGLLNLQRIRKPSWHAHRLLTILGEEQVDCNVEGCNACANAIATQKGGKTQFLAYTFRAEDTTHADMTEIIFKHDSLSQNTPLIYVVDETHNNAPAEWKRKGSPAYLTPEEAVQMRDDSQLQQLSAKDYVVEGDTVRVKLKGPGIVWLEC